MEKKTVYLVAAGHAFSCKRGMLKEGDEIKEKDFSSADVFKNFLTKGKIVESKGDNKKDDGILKELEADVTAALKTLDAAYENLAKAKAYRTEAAAKMAPANEALLAKEAEYPEIVEARKLLAEATNLLAKAKKPEAEAEALKKVSEAQTVLAEKQAAIPDVKTLVDTLAALNGDLADAETTLQQWEKEYADADSVLKKTELALANAREGK